MKPERTASLTQRHPRWRLALLLWLVCASCVQQWAAQSHWHVLALHGQVELVAPAGDQGDGLPAHDCLWCQAGAHAGSAAPPPAWRAPFLADEYSCITRSVASAAQPRTVCAWNWQSRGPPSA